VTLTGGLTAMNRGNDLKQFLQPRPAAKIRVVADSVSLSGRDPRMPSTRAAF